MGCWNETCGISRMPILYKDEVYFIITGASRVFIASESYEVNDTCAMFGFPIQGTYDDYGSIENIQCKSYVEKFFKSFKYGYEGDDKIEEYVFTTIEDFVKRISDVHSLFIIDEDGEHIHLTKFMVHKELYDAIVENYYNRICFNSTMTYKEAITALVQKKIKMVLSHELLPISTLSTLLSDYSECHIFTILDFIETEMRNGSDSSLYIDDIVEYLVFMTAMNNARIAFHGNCGLGSQSCEMVVHKIIADFVYKKIEKAKKEERRFEKIMFLPYDLKESKS